MGRIDEIKSVVDDAFYAMVAGNLSKTPVSVECVESWIKYIQRVIEIGEENNDVLEVR